MKKWQYKQLASPSLMRFCIDCNTLGQDGWELVSIVAMGDMYAGILKRPLKPELPGKF